MRPKMFKVSEDTDVAFEFGRRRWRMRNAEHAIGGEPGSHGAKEATEQREVSARAGQQTHPSVKHHTPGSSESRRATDLVSEGAGRGARACGGGG